MKNRVQNRLELMEIRQSGISVQGVREVRVWINAGRMLLARDVGGDGWVEIPDSLRRKGAVVDIQNTDTRCLIWCLCAFMLEQQGSLPDHKSRPRESLPGRRVTADRSQARQDWSEDLG